MFKGFYNLTSGMLSQTRRLDVISNNMTNVTTTGYKADLYTDSTFQEVMLSRVGNRDKSNPQEIGMHSYILAPDQLYTNFDQSSFEETGLPLDFAIEGDGFFAIQTGNGTAYTRAGNFMLDDEGYLCLPNQGRVLDNNEQPILLMTDKITTDGAGGLYLEDGGFMGQIGLYTFADNGQLERNAQGLFVGGGQATAVQGRIRDGMLERSNVELIQQMTSMMTTQRALQSAAQLTKMYDQVMNQATTDLGRI